VNNILLDIVPAGDGKSRNPIPGLQSKALIGD